MTNVSYCNNMENQNLELSKKEIGGSLEIIEIADRKAETMVFN